MNLRVVVRPEVADELTQAQEWYEGRSPGLGSDFIRAFEASVFTVQRLPEAFPVVHRQIRRAILRRFPYAIFYSLTADAIVVLACFHSSRDPHEWKRRAAR